MLELERLARVSKTRSNIRLVSVIRRNGAREERRVTEIRNAFPVCTVHEKL